MNKNKKTINSEENRINEFVQFGPHNIIFTSLSKSQLKKLNK